MNNPPTKDSVLFDIRMNAIYHERSERVYGLWLDVASITSITVSSIAFVSFAEQIPAELGGFGKVVGATAALAAVLLNAIVMGTGMRDKATRHSDLKRRWLILLRKLEKVAESDSELQPVLDDFANLNTEEPAPNNCRLRWAYLRACKALALIPDPSVCPWYWHAWKWYKSHRSAAS